VRFRVRYFSIQKALDIRKAGRPDRGAPHEVSRRNIGELVRVALATESESNVAPSEGERSTHHDRTIRERYGIARRLSSQGLVAVFDGSHPGKSAFAESLNAKGCFRSSRGAELMSGAVLRRRKGQGGTERFVDGEGLHFVVLLRAGPVSVEVSHRRGGEVTRIETGRDGQASPQAFWMWGCRMMGVTAFSTS